ncbi:MAG: hypothetical protein ACLSDO_03750 [Anaerotruncus colihominis]
MTQQYVDDFRIKVTGQDQLVGSLSGGTSKVVIGEAFQQSQTGHLDEPTRGIDAAARGCVQHYSAVEQKRRLCSADFL